MTLPIEKARALSSVEPVATPDVERLIERLRAKKWVGDGASGVWEEPINPDGPAAADMLAALGSKSVEPREGMREALERVRKVRDGYASQAKFCDIEPLPYFREFIARIDKALAGDPS